MTVNFFLATSALIGYLIIFIKHKIVIFEINFYLINIVILYLYVFGLLRNLNIGFYSLVIFGNIILLYYILKKSFDKKLLMNLFNYLLIIISFMIILYFFPKDIKLLNIDDFGIWGQNSRTLFLNNNFWNSSDSNYFKSYPPAGALIHYVATKTFGWSELTLFITHMVWIFSTIQFISSKIVQSRIIKVLSFLLTFPIYKFLGYEMTNINMDAILGLQFAACSLLVYKGNNLKNIFYLRLLSFSAIPVLILIKPSGFFFYPALFLIIILSVRKFSGKKQFSLYASNFLLVLIFYLSWQIYMKINNIGSVQGEYRFSRISDAQGQEILITIVKSIIQKTFESNPYGYNMLLGLSVFDFLLLLCLTVGISMARLVTNSIFNYVLLLNLGIIPYIVLLLATYMFLSPDMEAKDTSAYWRYLSSYLIAIITLSFFLFAHNLYINSTWMKYTLFVALPIFLYPRVDLADSFSFNRDLLYVRDDVENYVNNFQRYNKVKSNVYFISQNTNGYQNYLFHYLNLPSNSNFWCWSYGDIYNPQDIWTCKSNLEQELFGYEYLVVHYGDPNLHNFYPHLFTSENDNFNAIFKIVKNGETLRLLKIFD